jgi:hypothetical protein
MITISQGYVDDSKETNLQKKCTFTAIFLSRMKHYLISLLKLWIYWMLLFVLCRSIFLSFYISTILDQGISLTSVLLIYTHAIRIDIATACCLTIPSLLFLAVAQSFRYKIGYKINFWINWFLSVVCVLVYEGEIGLYQEWKTKINFKAVSALATPGDVLVSVSVWDTLLFFCMLAVLGYAIFFVLKKWVLNPMTAQGASRWVHWIALE